MPATAGLGVYEAIDDGPDIAGRARMGRIFIANSGASAYALVNGAIDAADRVVTEQLGG
jgi:hypothetical protein